MKPLVYFKLQAKNLFKDYKTQTTQVDGEGGHSYFAYKPKYFDIDQVFEDFGGPEVDFSLMKAQHLFARMLGFSKWADVAGASDEELELAKLLWDNQHKIGLDDWQDYIAEAESDNNVEFDTASKIAIFKQVFADVEGHQSPYPDYRLTESNSELYDDEAPRPRAKRDPGPQIISLPLSPALRAEFVEAANEGFENVMERIEARNSELTRKLWSAENYVDNELLREDMLPIDKDYALSLIDSFLVGHVIGLATQADRMAAPN